MTCQPHDTEAAVDRSESHADMQGTMQGTGVRIDTWLGHVHTRISARQLTASEDLSRVDVSGDVRVDMDGMGRMSCNRFRLWDNGTEASCTGDVSVRIQLPIDGNREGHRP